MNRFFTAKAIDPGIFGSLSKIVLFMMSIFIAVNSGAQICVVVDAKSPIANLTKEQATALFLGKSFSLPNGAAAQLIDQKESQPIRSEFYALLAGKNVNQVKSIWMRLVFSGKGVPPTEVGDSSAVLQRLTATPNSIGYIEKSALNPSVRVLLTLEK